MIRLSAIALFALVGLMTGTSPARAEDAATKALAPMLANVGTWSCEAKTSGEGSHAFKASVEYTKEFGGRALVERYEELASPQHSQPTKLVAVWSYDPRTKRIMRNGADLAGNAVVDSTAPMVDNRYAWENDAYKIPVVQATANQFSFSLTVPRDSKWVTIAEGTCTRQ